MLPQWLKKIFGAQPTEIAESNLPGWQDWILPVSETAPAGEDISYEDEFQALKEELSKISGIDSGLILTSAESLLKSRSKDLRVAAYLTYGKLKTEGIKGLADSLELICALLRAFEDTIWPRKIVQRKKALEWLCSEKIIDALSITPMDNKPEIERALSALILLQQLVLPVNEAFRPSFNPLLRKFEQVLADGSFSFSPASSDTPANAPAPASAVQMPAPHVRSAKDLLDQTRAITSYLRQQEEGYLAAYRLARAVRWETITLLPPVDDEQGRTKLSPPRADLKATLTRLMLQQQWQELLERVEIAFLEGANHFWLDLQYYAWQAHSQLGSAYAQLQEVGVQDLSRLLKRLQGIHQLCYSDGMPFAAEATIEWITRTVLALEVPVPAANSMPAMVEEGADWQALEAQAQALAESEGVDKAIAWMYSVPNIIGVRSECMRSLLMAKLADRHQKSEWALHLLEKIENDLRRISIGQWEPAFVFEIYAYLCQLLLARLQRKDVDKEALQVKVEQIKAHLMELDPVLALHVIR